MRGALLFRNWPADFPISATAEQAGFPVSSLLNDQPSKPWKTPDTDRHAVWGAFDRVRTLDTLCLYAHNLGVGSRLRWVASKNVDCGPLVFTNFRDSDATALAAHNNLVGGSWAVAHGGGLEINGNTAEATGTAGIAHGGLTHASAIDTGMGTVELDADVHTDPAADSEAGVLARVSPDPDGSELDVAGSIGSLTFDRNSTALDPAYSEAALDTPRFWDGRWFGEPERDSGITYTTNFGAGTDWFFAGGADTTWTNSSTSIFAGENASKAENNDSGFHARSQSFTAGADDITVVAIVERGEGSNQFFFLRIYDITAGSPIYHVAWFYDDLTIQSTSGSGTSRIEELDAVGPNGGRLIRAEIRGTPVSGNTTWIQVTPARVIGSGYLHYVAKETGQFGTSPIIADASVTTRNADDLTDTLPPEFDASKENVILVDWRPWVAGQGRVSIWGSYVDANNGSEILHDAGNLICRRRVGGVDHDATIALAYTAGAEYLVRALLAPDRGAIWVGTTKGADNTDSVTLQFGTTHGFGQNGNNEHHQTGSVWGFRHYHGPAYATDAAIEAAGSHIEAVVKSTGTTGWALRKVSGAEVTDLASDDSFTTERGATYRIRLRVHSDDLVADLYDSEHNLLSTLNATDWLNAALGRHGIGVSAGAKVNLFRAYGYGGAGDLVVDEEWEAVEPALGFGEPGWDLDYWGGFDPEAWKVPYVVRFVDAIKAARYWRLEVVDESNLDGEISVGSLLSGPRFDPGFSRGHTWGASVRWVDPSQLSEPGSRGLRSESRTPYRVVELSWPRLDAAGAAECNDLLRAIGSAETILVAPYPGGTAPIDREHTLVGRVMAMSPPVRTGVGRYAARASFRESL